MVCIYCGNSTQVINSRLQKRPNQVWRRRKCLQCGAVFTTNEAVSYESVWRVHTTSGKLVPFNTNVLLLSIYKSLEHRPTALRDAEALTATIMERMRVLSQNGLIERTRLVETAQIIVSRFDKAAGVSYAAFHPIT